MTQVHKVELLIVDHDRCGVAEIRTILEQGNYPNDCISPRVLSTDTKEVEWSDGHPLNKIRGHEEAVRQLFPPHESLQIELAHCTPEERINLLHQLFGHYCLHCGEFTGDHLCHCTNDE